MNAFIIYTSIYLSSQPDKAYDLLHYMYNIRKCATRLSPPEHQITIRVMASTTACIRVQTAACHSRSPVVERLLARLKFCGSKLKGDIHIFKEREIFSPAGPLRSKNLRSRTLLDRPL